MNSNYKNCKQNERLIIFGIEPIYYLPEVDKYEPNYHFVKEEVDIKLALYLMCCSEMEFDLRTSTTNNLFPWERQTTIAREFLARGEPEPRCTASGVAEVFSGMYQDLLDDIQSHIGCEYQSMKMIEILRTGNFLIKVKLNEETVIEYE